MHQSLDVYLPLVSSFSVHKICPASYITQATTEQHTSILVLCMTGNQTEQTLHLFSQLTESVSLSYIRRKQLDSFGSIFDQQSTHTHSYSNHTHKKKPTPFIKNILKLCWKRNAKHTTAHGILPSIALTLPPLTLHPSVLLDCYNHRHQSVLVE